MPEPNTEHETNPAKNQPGTAQPPRPNPDQPQRN